MSDDEKRDPVEPVDENYTIHLTLPEQRLSAAISAEVQLVINEEVGFNQLIYNVVQKPIDEKTPVMLPPGKYTLRMDATLLERVDEEIEDVVHDEDVEIETLPFLPEGEEPDDAMTGYDEDGMYTAPAIESTEVVEDIGELQALVGRVIDREIDAPTPRGKGGRGKGSKAVPRRPAGGPSVKPRRARR